MSAATSTSAEQRDQEVALLAKALGHPARVQILRLLLAHDACYCGELVDELPLAQATVLQHLKVLTDSGLITVKNDGTRTCYCASHDRLAELHELVGVLLVDELGDLLPLCDPQGTGARDHGTRNYAAGRANAAAQAETLPM